MAFIYGDISIDLYASQGQGAIAQNNLKYGKERRRAQLLLYKYLCIFNIIQIVGTNTLRLVLVRL